MTNYFRAQCVLCAWCRRNEWHPMFAAQICITCALVKGHLPPPSEPEMRVERGYN